MVQLLHLYMTAGKTIVLTVWTFVSQVMSLVFNMLSRFVITFLQRNKYFFFFNFMTAVVDCYNGEFYVIFFLLKNLPEILCWS